jgi:parvulin-like peptidyl-prolyl isomerase
VQNSGLVIAEIDQKKIVDRDFLSLIEIIEQRTPLQLESYPQRRELLDQLIHVELLYQEALAQGLAESVQFKTRLADAYVEELARRARQAITELDVKNEYARNPAAYDQISARHILLALPEGRSTSESVREEKRRRAQQLREELVQDPNLFVQYARQYSEDRSGRQGGELGFFIREQMDAEFSKAAFALKKVGDISPVVRSNFGYHIIQLTGDRRGLQNHQETIRSYLVQKNQRAILQRELDRLKENRSIQVYEENLSKISPLPALIKKDPLPLIEEK